MDSPFVRASPEELRLEGPFDQERRTVFTLVNTVAKNVCFKIKSTEPHKLSITPKYGYIRGLDRLEVFVTVCGKNRINPSVRDQEKFLIQSAVTAVPMSSWDHVSGLEALRMVGMDKITNVRLPITFLDCTKPPPRMDQENHIKEEQLKSPCSDFSEVVPEVVVSENHKESSFNTEQKMCLRLNDFERQLDTVKRGFMGRIIALEKDQCNRYQPGCGGDQQQQQQNFFLQDLKHRLDSIEKMHESSSVQEADFLQRIAALEEAQCPKFLPPRSMYGVGLLTTTALLGLMVVAKWYQR